MIQAISTGTTSGNGMSSSRALYKMASIKKIHTQAIRLYISILNLELCRPVAWHSTDIALIVCTQPTHGHNESNMEHVGERLKASAIFVSKRSFGRCAPCSTDFGKGTRPYFIRQTMIPRSHASIA